MLTQKLNALECCKHRIKGAAALFRCQCRMGPVSVEGYLVALLSQALDIGAGVRTAMHHESHIQLLKAAVLNHLNLAAKGLLGRGSIYYKLERLIRVQIL